MDYYLSDLKLRFPIEHVIQLSNELQTNEFHKEIIDEQIQITTTENAITYLKKYYSNIYCIGNDIESDDDSNDNGDQLVNVKNNFRYHYISKNIKVNMFPHKFEALHLQIMYNEIEIVILCYKVKWWGRDWGSDSDFEQFKIMSKYCEPFKILCGVYDETIQVCCFHGEIICNKLVDSERDIGVLSEKEWNHLKSHNTIT